MNHKINDEFAFENFGLVVVTFDEIFRLAQIQLKDKLRALHIIYIIVSFDRPINQLFLHYLLTQIFHRMSRVRKQGRILLIQPSFEKDMITDFDTAQQKRTLRYIFDNFNKIKNYLPFPIYVSDHCVDLTDIESGKTIDLLHILERRVQKHALRVPSARKLKEFAKKNGLQHFLSYCQTEDFKKHFYKNP